ncbi:DNA-binding protein [Pseudomonas cavernicola]|uniref:DNA-binding protein n=2 Tax=Pseudomonas cavernicola TaxID=2320866 RepID=A0A418XPG2_9PSED|nr:DNA-binding protein [Pseudomonas cavernicola]
MSVSESISGKYGPLLSLQELAEILHRSPDGLRIALRGEQAYAKKLNSTKVKIGRRIYFSTPAIARLISDEFLGGVVNEAS